MMNLDAYRAMIVARVMSLDEEGQAMFKRQTEMVRAELSRYRTREEVGQFMAGHLLSVYFALAKFHDRDAVAMTVAVFATALDEEFP